LIFGLLLIPLVLAAGVGVDYARAVQFKAQLQAATDDAALAGASAYVSSDATGQSLGIAAATNYMNGAIAALPANNGVTFTATPASTSSGSTVTAFQMTVTATATFPTTLMAVYKPTLTITTTATANNPIVTAKFNLSQFNSTACDANTIYWYIVPQGGGVPSWSSMNLLWTNNSANPPTTSSFQVAASQQIGFAVQNQTGARSASLGGCNYGNNYYGSQPNDTQWFYSSLQPPDKNFSTPPANYPYTSTTHGNYPSSYGDCNLQVIKGTGTGGTTFTDPLDQCFTTSGSNENYTTTSTNRGETTITYHVGGKTGPTMATEMTNAAPSCSALSGSNYEYAWNDMGGNPDDLDYNDLIYSFSCTGGSSGSGSGNGTTTSGVTLTN
jgi:Flp pilus assembly protein TadG